MVAVKCRCEIVTARGRATTVANDGVGKNQVVDAIAALRDESSS